MPLRERVEPLLERSTVRRTGLVVGAQAGGDAALWHRGRLPDGSRSILEIGSITKTFTATLPADMVREGLVALDDPVNRHLPEGARVPARGREITLEDLASHRSGLPIVPRGLRRRALWVDRRDPYARWDAERLEAALPKNRPRRKPGRKFVYSNYGAGLLGHVLALRVGTTYEDLVRERLCRPLGLIDTWIETPEPDVPRLAVGHDLGGRPVPHWHLAALNGAGGLRSTAADLLAFLRLHEPGAQHPLAAAAAETRRPRISRGKLTVGLGWLSMAPRRKLRHRVFLHEGGTGGFRSFAGFAPDTGEATAPLANQVGSVGASVSVCSRRCFGNSGYMSRAEISGPMEPRYDEVLTDDALELVARLHGELDDIRRDLLRRREEQQAELDAGGTLELAAAPEDFTVAPVPDAIQDRRVEITGPATRKMVINALNSGARVFMADFEDANSPYWANMAGGQVNLADAIRRTIEHDENGKHYELDEEIAALLVRPRGLHLLERHLLVDDEPVAGAFMDFGLYMHRNAGELLERGAGPFFYIPKLESHLEARLWRDAFVIAEDTLGLDRGTVKATVLVETIPAAFEMDAILYELRDHSAGLNAGRWDYIFSTIKRFRSRPDFVLPDRSAVTMTVPFMRAYTELLVKTCHRRGAHAIGGMAAVIPSRSDEEANRKAFEAVRADKEREAGDGFDGTWVAHPDSVPVATDAFDEVLGDRPNQLGRQREDVDVRADDLLAVERTPGEITEEGLRANVNVGIQYISSWLRGNGAAGIYGLMEDAATAEISRAQVWQWIRHGATLDDGREVTPEFARELELDELERIRGEIGDDEWFERQGRPDLSRSLFERVALTGDEFVEFLTLPAYEELLKLERS